MGQIVFKDNKILFVDNKIAFDCACECPEVCGPCSANHGTLDSTTVMKVVISGLTNGTFCSDCDDENGTYFLDIEFCESGLSQWSLLLDGPCAYNEIVAGVTSSDPQTFQVRLDAPAFSGVVFAKVLDDDDNCNEFVDFDLPPLSSSSVCDESSATCKVTSIAS